MIWLCMCACDLSMCLCVPLSTSWVFDSCWNEKRYGMCDSSHWTIDNSTAMRVYLCAREQIVYSIRTILIRQSSESNSKWLFSLFSAALRNTADLSLRFMKEKWNFHIISAKFPN